MKEVFRGVVWPRQGVFPRDHKGQLHSHPPMKDTDGLPVYRYAIVGVLITDEPITGVDGFNEVVLNGVSTGLADSIAKTTPGMPMYPLGDATSVLISLDNAIVEAPYPPGSKVDVFYGEESTKMVGVALRCLHSDRLICELPNGDVYTMDLYTGYGKEGQYFWAPVGTFKSDH